MSSKRPDPGDEILCECGEEIPLARFILGYETCLKCGSPNPTRTVAIPYNKGAYQLVTPDEVRDLGRK